MYLARPMHAEVVLPPMMEKSHQNPNPISSMHRRVEINFRDGSGLAQIAGARWFSSLINAIRIYVYVGCSSFFLQATCISQFCDYSISTSH